MYKHLYSRFLQARPDVLHCAPHSHYYWPDVTRQAQLDYWDDSAAMADEKWGKVFGEKVPAVQQGIANIMNLQDPGQVVFAPNTHEFVYRLMSCFDHTAKSLQILTTDGEFHSFNRQSRRLAERPEVSVTRIATEPFETFAERWQEAVASQHWDMIFISQVFYNSGVAAPEPAQWLNSVKSDQTLIAVDGYHGFAALPTDWSAYANRIFYLAGGYKYAQAGEGVCFMVVPKGAQHRPEYTGWFADFDNLTKPQQGPVEYSENGFRFAGATMDFSALYRMEAVFKLWQKEQLDTETRLQWIRKLQHAFLQHIDTLNHSLLNRERLLLQNAETHGHFYTFVLDSAEQVEKLAAELREKGIATDYRGNRLRFGFALYQDPDDFKKIRPE